jgi:catechol 2,3-dioxygenase-like lactoylglutathione lyase family enzyme
MMARMFGWAGVALLAMAATQTSAEPPATPVAPAATSGALIGPALHVGSVERSLKFYVDGLGMAVGMQMGPPQRHETILTFGGDPRSAGIILLSDQTATTPSVIAQSNGFDRVVLRMADLTATAERLRAAGFTPGEIHDVAMGYRMMLATDPDGYRFELVESRPRP